MEPHIKSGKNLKDMKVDKETYMMIDIYYLIVPNQSIIDHLSETYADNMGNRYYRNIDFRESVKDQLPALEEIRNSLGKIRCIIPGRMQGIRARHDVFILWIFLIPWHLFKEHCS